MHASFQSPPFAWISSAKLGHYLYLRPAAVKVALEVMDSASWKQQLQVKSERNNYTPIE